LFNKRLLAREMEKFDFPSGEQRDKINKIIKGWQIALKDHDLDKTKEKEIQGQFLSKFFCGILGYTAQTDGFETYTIKQEPSTEVDATNPDGSLGFYGSENITRAVIELKDAKTHLDKKQVARENKLTPIEQAFGYVNKYDRCDWVIVSNFNEIRLYHKDRGMGFYEKFEILELDNEAEFKRFYFCLCANNLLNANRQSGLDLLVKNTSKNEEEISKAFYKEFKELRVRLFNHIKANNSDIEPKLLIEKTQKLLDRMVFILFCEDTNNLLPHNIVKQIYDLGIKSRERSDRRVWREFKNLFQDIDEGRYDIDPPINAYNGGLFKFDGQLNDLIIKDDIWADIIKFSDYNFESDLNVNILGHIFEQSLSDLELLKAEIAGGEQDKTRSKRKKDGIFYTPEYITRYIVEQTVGKYLEENPDKLETIKILDPACGSGAFLNQAHSFLKEQYKIGYEEGRVKSKDARFGALFDYNPAEKDRSILLNNLYGVDLNEESVEITKLALWLKTAHKDHPLQDLSRNMKCGNSLIDDPEIAGDKAFSWKNEFEEIMNNGGFDVIIGNPPYGATLDEASKNYIYDHYCAIEYQIDTYVVFMQKAFELLKGNGRFSFIVPSTWLSMNFFEKTRNLFISQTKLEKIILFRYQVFEDVIAETCIFVCKKTLDNSFQVDIATVDTAEKMLKLSYSQISQVYWKSNYKNGFNIFYGQDKINLIEKLFNEKYKLKDLVDIIVGIKPYQTGKGAPKQTKKDVENRIFDATRRIDEFYKPYLTGSNIFKYSILNPEGKWLKYGNWLAEPRKSLDFSKDKIVIRQTSDKIICAVDKNGYLSLNNVHNVIAKENVNLQYLITVLNSKLMDFIYKYLAPETGRVFAEVKIVNLEKLPIPKATPEQQESLAKKAASIMELKKTLQAQTQKALELLQAECKPKKISQKLKEFHTLELNVFFEELAKQGSKLSLRQKEELMDWHREKSDVLSALKSQIDKLDNDIDREVYALYNLTQEEIEIMVSVYDEL